VSDRPNVVVYISHDTGQHIGPYGIRTVHTPNADRLAAEGALFTHSFCTAPQCSPSRAGLFTGRHPHAVGVMGLTDVAFGWTLSGDEIHLARHLGRLGYETALFGLAHEAVGGDCSESLLDPLGFDFRIHRLAYPARQAPGILPPGWRTASTRRARSLPRSASSRPIAGGEEGCLSD